MQTDNFIKIWKFEDAPAELQALSQNGGDEDWIAVIPSNSADEYIGWLEEGSSFGCFGVDEFKHPTLEGFIVKIGCHA